MASARVTSIGAGSDNDADMKIKIKKTKVMHARPQDPVVNTTHEEAVKTCRFVCPHLGCGFHFYTKPHMQGVANGVMNMRWNASLSAESRPALDNSK